MRTCAGRRRSGSGRSTTRAPSTRWKRSCGNKTSFAARLVYRQRNPPMRCCFIPPHMLRALSASGDAAQRERAHAALEMSAQFRGQRAVVTAAAAPPDAANLSVYDARHQRDLPGVIVRGRGDAAAGAARDGAAKTYDLHRRACDRDSVDGRALALISDVPPGVT